MNRWQYGKITACLLALVLVSGLIGGLLGHRLARLQQQRRNNPENWNEAARRTFERVVKPSPEQGQKLEARLNAAVEELKVIRADTLARSSNVIWRLVAEVEKELTPEQRSAFETMKPKQGELSSLEILRVEPKQNK